MSTKYNHNDTIPSPVICERLLELSHVFCQERDRIPDETTMRIPAERDRDIDIVLSEAARRISELETEIASIKAANRTVEELRSISKHRPYSGDWSGQGDGR